MGESEQHLRFTFEQARRRFAKVGASPIPEGHRHVQDHGERVVRVLPELVYRRRAVVRPADAEQQVGDPRSTHAASCGLRERYTVAHRRELTARLICAGKPHALVQLALIRALREHGHDGRCVVAKVSPQRFAHRQRVPLRVEQRGLKAVALDEHAQGLELRHLARREPAFIKHSKRLERHEARARHLRELRGLHGVDKRQRRGGSTFGRSRRCRG